MKLLRLLVSVTAIVFLVFTGAHASLVWLDSSFNYNVSENGANLFVQPDFSNDIPLVGDTPAFSKDFNSTGDPLGSVAQSTAGPDNVGLGLTLKAGATGNHLANGVRSNAYLESSNAQGNGIPNPWGIEPNGTVTQQVISLSVRRFEVDSAGNYTVDGQLVGGLIDAVDVSIPPGPGGTGSSIPAMVDYNWSGGVTLFENTTDSSGTVTKVSAIASIELQELLAGTLMSELVYLRPQDGSGNAITYDLKAHIGLNSLIFNFSSFAEDWSEIPPGALGSLGTEADPLVLEASINAVPIPSETEIYFPHIASNAKWETEICLINSSSTQTVNGTLLVFNNSGNQVAMDLSLNLSPNARHQIVIGEQFDNAENIGYAIYKSDSNALSGYTKFYIPGTYRVAVPAISEINSGNIYVSHIASSSDWWTGVSLVNTTSEQKNITIEFDNGQTVNKTIAGNEHQAFTIASLFDGQSQDALKSAVIKNARGIIGLELFGSRTASSDSYLSGILLTDQTTSEIYYPHVASDEQWWTGVVAYNPGSTDCDLTITTFSEDGTILNISNLTLTGKEKYVGTAKGLGVSADTAWFSIVSASPITGFEVFGTLDGNQMGGYTGVGIQRREGVFAKVEKQGWTGIAFVNTDATNADITIYAYEDDGTMVASESLTLAPNEKLVGMAEQLFPQNISNANYISFVSNNDIVGFQLNGSSDGMMLDALPGM
jgi:hypothetical protein